MLTNDTIVKTKVVEFILNKESRGRRNQPRLPKGTKLYAIEYELGGYFTYSYTSRESAEQSRQNQIKHNTNTYQFYGFNCVKDPNDTLPSSHTIEPL